MNEQFEKWFENETKAQYAAPNEKAWAFAAWQASREALWQTMDSAPKDGTFFVCYDKKPSIEYGYDIHNAFFDLERERFVACNDSDTDIYDIMPTHWMIPVLPKQGE